MFFALIFMLTFVMTAAAGVRDFCVSSIKKCDDEYRSVALIEYLGSEYPDKDEPDEYARETLNSLDVTSIEAVDGVRAVTVPRRDGFYFDGFRQADKNPMVNSYGIVIACNIGRKQSLRKVDRWYTSVPVDKLTPYDIVEYYYTMDEFDEDGKLLEKDRPYALVVHEEIKETVYYSAIVTRSLFSGTERTNVQINLLPGDSGFVPDPDKKYILHGIFLGKTSLEAPSNGIESFIVSWIEGSDATPYAVFDGDATIPGLFIETAEKYTYANNYVFAEYGPDVRDIYVFQQGELYLKDGDFPAPDDEGGCVITADLASSLGIGIGDTITGRKMTVGEDSVYDLSIADGSESFTVRGVVKDTNEYTGHIWAIGKCGSSPFFGYTLASVSLQNDKAEDAVDMIRGTLPPLTRISLFDQGYGDAVKPFRSIASAAADVIAVCAAGTAASLLLFAFVFVGRQSYSVKIMISLGTPRRGIATWLLSGATVISGTAAILGGVVAWFTLPLIYKIISRSVGGAGSSLRPYSELSLGVTHSIKVKSEFSPIPVIVCVAAVILTLLLFCVVFLLFAYRGASPKKGKMRIRVPAGKTSVALRGSLRFSVLSIRRGGRGSLVVPAVCAVLTAVIIILGGVFTGWRTQLDKAYDDTEITGHAVSTCGRFYSELLVPIKDIRTIMKTDGVGDVFVSSNYRYYVESEMPTFADSGFGRERQESWKRSGASVISLNDLRAAKDFFYTEPSVEWLDGWDESFLANYKSASIDEQFRNGYYPDSIPAIFSDSFMESHSLSPGDAFSVQLIYEKTYFEGELTLNFDIVGSYKQIGSEANIYIPLTYSYPPDRLGIESDYFDPTTFSTCRFTVRSADSLETLRQSLGEKGFTRVGGKAGIIRTTIILEDASFIKLTETLGRYISMGRTMAVLISAVVTLIGFIVSWLMINGRKREFALMRGFGARGGRIFASFFIEQAILCFSGCAVGCLVMLVTGAGALKFAAVGGYILFYLMGCAISTHIIGKTKLMELFAVRD